MIFLTRLCYTLFMEGTYWLKWEKFLQENGLKPFVRGMLTHSRSLVILLSQMMLLGIPLFRGLPQGREYLALIETFGDQARIKEFSDLLMEVGG
jgi:hypothetical protein